MDEVDFYLKEINISEHFMWLVSENCQDNLESLGKKNLIGNFPGQGGPWAYLYLLFFNQSKKT